MNYVFPHRYFHITQHDLGEKAILKPSGEYKPAGVSFSPSIRGCLEGVPFYYNRNGNERIRRKDWKERKDFAREGNTWHVYTPIKRTEAIIPDTIDDFERTRERRVLHHIPVTRIGIITVTCLNNKWEYQWQKPKEIKRK